MYLLHILIAAQRCGQWALADAGLVQILYARSSLSLAGNGAGLCHWSEAFKRILNASIALALLFLPVINFAILYTYQERNKKLMLKMHCMKNGPGARFSKVPNSFRTRKAITKILNLKYTEPFFSQISNVNKVSLQAKFPAYALLCF